MIIKIDDVEVLDVRTVLAKLGISKTKLTSIERDGFFPKPIKIGQMGFWPKKDVEDFIKTHPSFGKGRS